MKENSMNASLMSQARPAVLAMLALSLITGVAYPLLVTALAQAAFPWQANGSFVAADGAHAETKNVAGSALIGQSFDNPRYFWSRVSATSPVPYDASASSGSNLAPTNPRLLERVEARIAALRGADGAGGDPIPVDLVTSSASGLDPHISPAAASWQIQRVAAARGLDESKLRALVLRHTERRQLGVLGEPRVNVLLLNLALDRSSAR
jgi:K+-transporting ATPase ATPase C chain